MISRVGILGNRAIRFITRCGKITFFLLRILTSKPRMRRLFPLIIEQIYVLGVCSLLIVLVSSVFIGMVLGLQGYNILEKFGVTAQLGQLVALSVTRELAPVITGILFAGRAGTSLTAEIGLMQATEQIASMEMMAVDPIWRIVLPRFWAGFISMPILTVLFML